MLERTIEDEMESGDEEKMEISDEENDFPPLPQKGRHGGDSDGEEFSSDDGEGAESMMKKLNFPMVEKEVQPASVVPKVSVAIQKRVAKLAEHKMTLEAVEVPNEMHK
ncbi:unnamed protein product, partial [Durusdinium trenchii]